MTIQQFHKNTIRHRKNNQWLQSSGNSEKPENNIKLKILKISRNYHKPSLSTGIRAISTKLHHVTKSVTFSFYSTEYSIITKEYLIGMQFLFVGTGPPRPYFRYIIHGKNKESLQIYDLWFPIPDSNTISICRIGFTITDLS